MQTIMSGVIPLESAHVPAAVLCLFRRLKVILRVKEAYGRCPLPTYCCLWSMYRKTLRYVFCLLRMNHVRILGSRTG